MTQQPWQHAIGLLLAGYLIGFSIDYARNLFGKMAADAENARENPASDTQPLTWKGATGLVLRYIPPSLLWPYRLFRPRSPQATSSKPSDRSLSKIGSAENVAN